MAGSHADKGWPLISLARRSLVPRVPLCPLYHLAEADSREMLHTSIYKGLCLKGLRVMGWIWIQYPSSSLLLSCGINTPLDIKRALLICFKILFHSPIGIQDDCYEPLNPTVKSSGKLNVSAHALMWFYNSDFSIHDVRLNYVDICSHQNGKKAE